MSKDIGQGSCFFHGEIDINRAIRIRRHHRPAYLCPMCATLLKIDKKEKAA